MTKLMRAWDQLRGNETCHPNSWRSGNENLSLHFFFFRIRYPPLYTILENILNKNSKFWNLFVVFWIFFINTWDLNKKFGFWFL